MVMKDVNNSTSDYLVPKKPTSFLVLCFTFLPVLSVLSYLFIAPGCKL